MKIVTECLGALRSSLAISSETAWTENLIFSFEKLWIYSKRESEAEFNTSKIVPKNWGLDWRLSPSEKGYLWHIL